MIFRAHFLRFASSVTCQPLHLLPPFWKLTWGCCWQEWHIAKGRHICFTGTATSNCPNLSCFGSQLQVP